MRTCTSCKQPTRSADLFCSHCGQPLPAAGPPPDPHLGTVIADRFLLTMVLGEGGSGSVYLATHQFLDTPMAIKLLNPTELRSASALSRFYREAMTAGAMNHPYLVKIYDCGHTADGAPYLAMEYLDGVTLHQAIHEAPECGMTPGRALDICNRVAQALHHLHQRQVVHRDIKPKNIMLTVREGDPEWVTVLDFGVAKMLGQPALTQAGTAPGTLGYMAPEMLVSGMTSTAVDIYALGATLFEALTGTYLFDGDTAQIVTQQLSWKAPRLTGRRPDLRVSGELEAFLLQMLDADPARRPDAGQVVAELSRLRAQHPRSSARRALLTLVQPVPQASPSGAETMLTPAVRAALDRKEARKKTEFMAELAGLEQLDHRQEQLLLLLDQSLEALQASEREAGRGSWPVEAAALQEQLAQIKAKTEHHEIDLAVLQEKLAENQAFLTKQQQALSIEVLACSERLRDLGMLPPDRARLLEQRLELDQRIHDLSMRYGLALRTERIDLYVALNRLREQHKQALIDLARFLLKAPRTVTKGWLRRESPPLVGPARRERLEELIEQIEDTALLLARLK